MDRIKKIASYTLGSQVVCDIGCDHAYSLIYAIKEYGVKHGIAADIAAGPLANARKTIEDNHLSNLITIVQSDGFESIDESFDTAILSGMGGILICEILRKSLEKINGKKLIIEANNDAYRIRKFLFEHGFYLYDETALYDHGKYYEIMVFMEGRKSYTPFEIQYGPILLKEKPDAFLVQYQKKRNLLISIYSQIQDPQEKESKRRLIEELDLVLKV